MKTSSQGDPDNEVAVRLAAYKAKLSDFPRKAVVAAKDGVVDEMVCAFQSGKFDIALEKSIHMLGAIESIEPLDHLTHAACTHNVASCLHQLASSDADEALAKAYYEMAIEELQVIPTSRITWLFYGDLNGRQLSYIKDRLEQLQNGRKPESRAYLDEYGKLRKWSDKEVESAIARMEASANGAPQAFSWFSPTAVYNYIFGVRTAVPQPLSQQDGSVA